MRFLPMSCCRSIGAIAILIFSISCAQQERDPSTYISGLLDSNELQRLAHLEGNAALLAREVADSMISAQNGDVSVITNAQLQQRFEQYFQIAKYTSWDDVQPPIIELSNDGSMASVVVHKYLDIQYMDSLGNLSAPDYSLWSWSSNYQLVGEDYKIHAITSTSRSLSELEAAQLPISHSTTFATIPERALIPEGVAYDAATGTTYLSSTYEQRILAINEDGTYHTFAAEGEDGLSSTVGMEVDEKHRKLWVVSTYVTPQLLPVKFPDSTAEWSSRIYEYRLPDGDLLNIHDPEIVERYSFNDLCVASDGTVFITDCIQNLIYELNPSSRAFEPLDIPDSLFTFANGITISDGDRYLYISGGSRIVQYDRSHASSRYLEKPEAIDDSRIDGLAYYEGTLIANQPYRNRILQFVLDEEAGKIKHQKILEANHPAFDQPTTGEIAGDRFIYLANAQMRSGFENGQLRPEADREDVVLLSVGLRH